MKERKKVRKKERTYLCSENKKRKNYEIIGKERKKERTKERKKERKKERTYLC